MQSVELLDTKTVTLLIYKAKGSLKIEVTYKGIGSNSFSNYIIPNKNIREANRFFNQYINSKEQKIKELEQELKDLKGE